jgi:hypothetical protein
MFVSALLLASIQTTTALKAALAPECEEALFKVLAVEDKVGEAVQLETDGSEGAVAANKEAWTAAKALFESGLHFWEDDQYWSDALVGCDPHEQNYCSPRALVVFIEEAMESLAANCYQ